MFLQNRNADLLMRMGMLSLLIGFLWHWFVRPTAFLSDKWIDGIFGLFVGFAITLLLCSISRRKSGPAPNAP
jgi:hypothetical protein